MTHDGDLESSARGGRTERIRQLVADCLHRCAQGEAVSEDSLIKAHPDLMPELGEQLLKLRLIRMAYRQAETTSDTALTRDPVATESRVRSQGSERPEGQEEDTGLPNRQQELPAPFSKIDQQLGLTDVARELGLADTGAYREESRLRKTPCPHCHNDVDIEQDEPSTELICSSCGSFFSIPEGSVAGQGSPEAVPKTLARFQLLEQLGSGAFGVVWKARDTELERLVAVKIPRWGQLDVIGIDYLLREARAVAQLRHPGIVSIHEVAQEGELFYIVSDFIEGFSLHEWLTRERPTSDQAARLCQKIAEALHHAHESGVIHRDLKPSNVMIDTQGEPHIMDFGLAKRESGEATLTVEGEILGTPAYMSPEQARGEGHEADRRSDVYSAGVILFELLTGERPFRGNPRTLLKQVVEDEPPSPRKLDSQIPRDLETICLKCLQKEATRRYASAQELADDLGRYLRREPIHARPTAGWERALKWARRRPAAAMLIAVSTLALIGMGAGGVLYARFAQQRLQIAQRDLRERDAFDTLRTEVQQLIARGQEAVSASRLQDAQVQLSAAMAKIGSDARLSVQQEHAERLLDQVKSSLNEQSDRNTVRQQYQEFQRLRDDALFYGSQFTGLDPTANLRATRSAAEQALSLVGSVSEEQDSPLLTSAHLNAQEKAQVREGCYELLLTLAEAVAQPIAPEENDQEQASRALGILERAQQLLGRATRAYHLQRAKYLAQQNKPLEAAREQQRLSDPNLDAATAVDHFLTGKLLLGTQRPGRDGLAGAVGHFESALRLDPDHFWAQYHIALCQLRSQRADLAKAHLTACVGQRPNFVWIYILKGFVHAELAEFDSAEADFRKAEQLQPDQNARYILLVNRGVMWFRKGELEQAVADLQEAIQLQPVEFQGHVNLAQVYQKQKKYAEAENHFAQAIRLQPALAALYRSRAALRLERRQLDGALRDFEEAIRWEPGASASTAEDYTQKGRILQHHKQHDGALEAYEAALAIDPDYPTAHLLRAELLLELKRHKDALASLDAYFRKGNRTVDAHVVRGLTRATLGDYAGAIDDYSHALELQPESRMFAHRGWAYVVSDAPKIALRDFEEAIRLDPDNGDAHNGRGFALVKLGEIPRGIADAEQAVRLGPAESRTFYNAARTYAQATARLRLEMLRRNDQYRQTMELLSRCHSRCLELIRSALELQAPNQRRQFWQVYVEADVQLNPVRGTPGFASLRARYVEAGQ
jgi:tetratricopeptide (TPR) repeat protein